MEFILTLLAPMLWASATLSDVMLVNGKKADSTPMALTAMSGFFNLLFGLIIVLPIVISKGQFVQIESLPTMSLVFLISNGATQTAAVILFLKALRLESDVGKVDPWLQTIPAFGLLFAYAFIGEKLEWYHIAAIAVTGMGGWLILSKGIAARRVVLCMIGAAFLFATNDVIFAKFGRGLDLWPAILLDVSGKALFGLTMLFGAQARQGFSVGLKTKFGLQIVSEGLFIAADFVFDRAKLIAPVAIVQGIACTQPVFTVFGFVLIMKLTNWLPKEEFQKETRLAFWKKMAGIVLMVIGGAVIASTVKPLS